MYTWNINVQLSKFLQSEHPFDHCPSQNKMLTAVQKHLYILSQILNLNVATSLTSNIIV